MMRYSTNSKGRTFIREKSVGESFRANIIDDTVAEGGYNFTPNSFAKRNIISQNRAYKYKENMLHYLVT